MNGEYILYDTLFDRGTNPFFQKLPFNIGLNYKLYIADLFATFIS